MRRIAVRWCCAVIAATGLSACGTLYVSPQIIPLDGTVAVVPLTAENVVSANSTVPAPRDIPAAFRQVAGDPGRPVTDIAAPTPSMTAPQRPDAQVTRLPPPPPQQPYRIGVGDVLLLGTQSREDVVQEFRGRWTAQNGRQGYTVQDDGAITVPDVGRIVLAGLTAEEAEAQVFQSLVANGKDPTFGLEIAEFKSQRVAIGGAVVAPRIVPISLTPLFLDEALTLAGGVATPDVDFATIRIYRAGALYQIPLSQYLSSPALQKTRLIAGDSVFLDTAFELEAAQAYFAEQITLAQFRQEARVQALTALATEIELRRAALSERRANYQSRLEMDAVARDHVYLTGEVTRPGRFALPFGRHATLADALFAEGGFSAETANPSQIYVLRKTPGAAQPVTAWHLDARNVGNLTLATQMQLSPDDIIFIAAQPVTRWNRVVQQLVPSLITTGAGIAAN